jgi:hypothetical protein
LRKIQIRVNLAIVETGDGEGSRATRILDVDGRWWFT